MRPLTILVSPPGYGKTTLLSQWFRHRIDQDGALVSWLSLDREDGEPDRFLAYLILSISRAGIDLGKVGINARHLSMDANLSRMIADILAAIDRQPKKLLIILDDYHRLASPGVDKIVEMIIDKGGDKIHLAISGRQRPTFQTSVLNTRGQINYVDASDLVLSEAEAQTILRPDVSRADVALVHAHTEGWAVALQLARLWLDRGKRNPQRLRDFSGQSAEMAAYLVEQVVSDLPEHLREFVLETSILDRFNADLADSVRMKSDSRRLLDQLADFNTLLVPLDDNRNWYRYHNILAEFLVLRLHRTSSGIVPDLHRRAARSLAAHDDLILATNHALAAGDQNLAVQLVADAGGWELMLSHGTGYTRSLLKKFPNLTVRSVLVLQLMQAYLDAKLGFRDKAMEMLRLAEFSKADFTPVQHRDLLVISAMVRFYLDEMKAVTFLSDLQEDLASLDKTDHLARAVVGAVVVAGAVAWGNVELASQASLIAAREMRSTSSTRGTSYILLHQGNCQMVCGHLRDAETLFIGALSAAEEQLGTENAVKGIIGCLLGYSCYLDNRLEEAERWIARSLDSILTVGGWFDVFAAAYEILVRTRYQQHGVDAAMKILEQASVVARERNLARLTGLTAAWRIELLAKSGYVIEARREAAAANLEACINETALPHFAWRIHVASTIAIAEIHFASGNSAQAWHLLHQSTSRFLHAGLIFAARRMQALGLLALKEHPGDDRMIRDLEDCLDFIAKEGGQRIILDCGVGIESVLQNALKNGARFAGHRRVVLDSLLKELRNEKRGPTDEFSAAELKVLRELRSGRPNKAIARTLDLSENTVKFHLKNIYRKLDVASRLAAITAATQRNLLDF